MDKKEYRKVCTNEHYLKELRSAAIVGYILVGVEVVIAFLSNIWALMDAGVLAALVLGFHSGKKKGYAVALMVYSVFNVVYFLLMEGSLAGVLPVLVGIYAIKAFSIADKEFEQKYGIR